MRENYLPGKAKRKGLTMTVFLLNMFNLWAWVATTRKSSGPVPGCKLVG